MDEHTAYIYEATLEEIKRGYMENDREYICVCCGNRIEKGVIYPVDGILYEASRFIQIHIEQEHSSVFEYLITLDKSESGLSDIQRKLLAKFYEGKKDADIQKELGMGSTSTIRNHRFVLKEKERQAKVLLAVMELLGTRNDTSGPAELAAPISKRAGRNDDRYSISASEQTKVLNKYFPHGPEGPLKTFTMQEKHRIIVMNELAKRFIPGREYTETEVNSVLEQIYEDYVTIRRYMIDYGILSREDDGSKYFLTTPEDKEGKQVSRREELQQQAKEIKIEAGVYQIRNKENGKMYIASTPNLKTINGQKFTLNMGSHRNRDLQGDWSSLGEGAFEIEVLEKLKVPEGNIFFDAKDALRKLEASWLDKLQPYGANGYNTP
ncbi:DUF2087 domain-containing protein [Neobacillus mesonae]|nr:DUF2087 domain-containing protein [Neobacillus mesonae]